MQIRILAIGRGRGEEANLVQDYLARALKTGRAFGISAVNLQELDERKLREKSAQCEALSAALAGEAYLLLDERGENLSSPQFAQQIANSRDQGLARLNFVIGGADGVTHNLRQGAMRSLSLGKMVWPHMLARAMLSEQIYRATTIWAGSPYHRS